MEKDTLQCNSEGCPDFIASALIFFSKFADQISALFVFLALDTASTAACCALNVSTQNIKRCVKTFDSLCLVQTSGLHYIIDHATIVKNVLVDISRRHLLEQAI